MKFVDNLEIETLLINSGFISEYNDGVYSSGAETIRLCANGEVNIAEKDFDRWANSSESTIDAYTKSGFRKLNKFLSSIDYDDRGDI